MCTVLPPLGGNPIAVNKYIISYHNQVHKTVSAAAIATAISHVQPPHHKKNVHHQECSFSGRRGQLHLGCDPWCKAGNQEGPIKVPKQSLWLHVLREIWHCCARAAVLFSVGQFP
jgi:hypothetical protein